MIKTSKPLIFSLPSRNLLFYIHSSSFTFCFLSIHNTSMSTSPFNMDEITPAIDSLFHKLQSLSQTSKENPFRKSPSPSPPDHSNEEVQTISCPQCGTKIPALMTNPPKVRNDRPKKYCMVAISDALMECIFTITDKQLKDIGLTKGASFPINQETKRKITRLMDTLPVCNCVPFFFPS